MTDPGAKTIFFDALDLPANERASFLDAACADNPDQRSAVEALLAAHDDAESFLDLDSATRNSAPFARPDQAFRNVRTREQAIGEQVGPYTITDYIGEGGFGMVYRAEQTEPVQRPVALKIIKPGMDSQQVLKRFSLERAALAMMDHPGIARVYDAGAVDDGRPYVVMEFVDGEPLTTFCDSQSLSIEQRLRLFQRVCRAVQHAHQKGVVHRDLKPSNILCAMIDGEPMPRVIDFGIAKAIQETSPDAAANATAITHESQIIGTPQYMSPEQASMRNAEIDTRSDIYSLGVILYELLTGVTPVDGEVIRAGGWRAAEKLICETEPARPSSRIVDLGNKAEHVAACRHLDGHRLWRTLKGDLDWIVMRALEHDPARRYPTADALADDVERYLASEPVSAGPPSRLYKLGKLARRHRLELVTATTIIIAILALAAGGVWFGISQKKANDESQERLVQAEALSTFLQEIFLSVDPATAQGADTTLLRSILEDARSRAVETLSDHPVAAVNMLNIIGGAYLSLADIPTAEDCFRQALEYGLEHSVGTAQECMDARGNLAAMLAQQRKFEEAGEHFMPVLAHRQKTLGPDHLDTLNVQANLGYSLHRAGRYDDAKRELTEVYDRSLRLFGETDSLTLRVKNNLAMVHSDLGDAASAAAMLEEVLAAQRETAGPTHPRTLSTMNNLAGEYETLGRHAEALELIREALEGKRQIYAEDHPSILISINSLAGSLAKNEYYDEAYVAYQDALEFAHAIRPEGHPDIAKIHAGLATYHATLEQFDRAIDAIDTAVTMLDAALGPQDPNTLTMKTSQARVYFKAGRYDDAITVADFVIKHGTEHVGPDWPNVTKAQKTRQEANDAKQ